MLTGVAVSFFLGRRIAQFGLAIPFCPILIFYPQLPSLHHLLCQLCPYQALSWCLLVGINLSPPAMVVLQELLLLAFTVGNHLFSRLASPRDVSFLFYHSLLSSWFWGEKVIWQKDWNLKNLWAQIRRLPLSLGSVGDHSHWLHFSPSLQSLSWAIIYLSTCPFLFLNWTPGRIYSFCCPALPVPSTGQHSINVGIDILCLLIDGEILKPEKTECLIWETA